MPTILDQLDNSVFVALDQPCPKEPGMYLWQGSETLGIELLTVKLYPSQNNYGVLFPEYLGVKEHRGRNIEHYSGRFSKRLAVR